MHSQTIEDSCIVKLLKTSCIVKLLKTFYIQSNVNKYICFTLDYMYFPKPSGTMVYTVPTKMLGWDFIPTSAFSTCLELLQIQLRLENKTRLSEEAGAVCLR